MIHLIKNLNNHLFLKFSFVRKKKKNPGAVWVEDIKNINRRSFTDIKVVENTHTQMERRRAGKGGGEGSEGGM